MSPARINEALALKSVAINGAPYRYAALPKVGSGMMLDELQWMALDTYNKSETDLAAGVETRLKGLGKSVVKYSQPLPYGKQTVAELKTRLEPFVNTVLPMLKQLGGVK